MAGESAEEVARRAREKAERLMRHAAAYEKGAAGERATSEILAALPPEEWTVLHDLRWPGRQRANIDHVVIGPTGIYVIDSKNWAGSITVSGDVLRQSGYSRGPEIDGALAARDAIAGLVPSLKSDAFVAVLCLTREEPIKDSVRGVAVCSTMTLIELLTGRPRILSPEWLDYLRIELDMSTRAATDPILSPAMPVADVVRPRKGRRERRPRATHTAAPARSRGRRRKAETSTAEAVLALVVLAGLAWWIHAHAAQPTPPTPPTGHVTHHQQAHQKR